MASIEVAWVGRVCIEIDAKTILARIRIFHATLMHDGVYCGPHYATSKGKSHL